MPLCVWGGGLVEHNKLIYTRIVAAVLDTVLIRAAFKGIRSRRDKCNETINLPVLLLVLPLVLIFWLVVGK